MIVEGGLIFCRLAVNVLSMIMHASSMTKGGREPGEALIEAKPYALSSICPGDKVALFYHRSNEMLDTVISLLKEGVRHHEMCVFMSRSSSSEIKDRFKALGLDIGSYPGIMVVPTSILRMEEYSFETIADQMRALVHQARGQGYSGARLIMDVPEELAEQVPEEGTWRKLDLIREELEIAVVCMYDLTTLSPKLLMRSLTSYPIIIEQGMLCQNYFHRPSKESGSTDISRDLFQQLNTIRTENVQRMMVEEERSQLILANERLHEENIRRKMVEFALLQAENNQRIMLDAMTEMVLMVDRELKVTQGNSAFVKFLEGLGLDTAFEGKTIFELFIGLPAENRYLYEEIFQYGYTTVTEESVTLMDGRTGLQVHRVPVFKGDMVEMVVVIFRPQPVTEFPHTGIWELAPKLKAAVRDPQGPLGTTLNKYPRPVLVHDIDGNLYLYNESICSELGYSWEELAALGNTREIIIPSPEDKEPYRRFNIGGRISAPATLQRKDGTRVDVMRYLIFMGKGKERRIISVLRPL